MGEGGLILQDGVYEVWNEAGVEGKEEGSHKKKKKKEVKTKKEVKRK